MNWIPKQTQDWCNAHGWTDLFFQEGQFYGFPPSAVIPTPIPKEALPNNSFIEAFLILSPHYTSLGLTEEFYLTQASGN